MEEGLENRPDICPECYRPITEHAPDCEYPARQSMGRIYDQQMQEINETLRAIMATPEGRPYIEKNKQLEFFLLIMKGVSDYFVSLEPYQQQINQKQELVDMRNAIAGKFAVLSALFKRMNESSLEKHQLDMHYVQKFENKADEIHTLIENLKKALN